MTKLTQARLVLHAVHSHVRTVVVSSRNTDVLLILVSHFQPMQRAYIWMKSDTSTKRRYAVINKLTRRSAASLLAFYALVGCDTTSCITNHTKRSSWKIFKEHLQKLGIGELTEKTIKSSETFVCRICNVHRTEYIDAARHLLLSKTEESEAMTPTSDVLLLHLTRVQ